MTRLGLLPLALVALTACGSEEPPASDPSGIVVVTFNTGTTPGLGHDSSDDGYGAAEATLSDLHYGNGLAWRAVVDDTRNYLTQLAPDVIAFQEIFHSDDCAAVPEAARPGFVCESWQPGDPTVAQTILGQGYQVACHQGKADKCIGVKTSFGRFAGCEQDLCLDFLDGKPITGCGGGSRVGRGVIELAAGGTLTVVNLHGNSGLKLSDTECRVALFAAVFEDFDGQPAVSGEQNVVLGDLNTDPGRNHTFDASAVKWNEHVGPGKAFRMHTAVGPDVLPTYAGNFNIDHVASDAFAGTCVHPGATPGSTPVSPIVYFDHKPAVCRLR